ncbi:hypothetical protein [Streptomyces sediminimaris]|uniref:hypothetical protein n=1 Tax=Streptomyces sediminimaris TaxID=3383721 RepID=UPI00399B86E7
MTGSFPFVQAGGPGQTEYEMLRAQVMEDGRLPDSLAAARFQRRGLAGLICWPAGETVFRAQLVGACRPAWSPYEDPRVQTLADVFALLLAAADRDGRGHPRWQGRWA